MFGRLMALPQHGHLGIFFKLHLYLRQAGWDKKKTLSQTFLDSNPRKKKSLANIMAKALTLEPPAPRDGRKWKIKV